MAEHIRIDEGVKRGAQHPHKPPIRPVDAKQTEITAGLNPHEVLDKYLTERTTSQIAQSYGVSRKALVRWLREVVPDEWNKVQLVRALIRKEDGDEGIEGACDALSLARAREMLRSGQWDLERLDRKNYGQDTQIAININQIDTLNVALTAAAGDLLGKLRTVAPQQQIEQSSATEAEVLPPDTNDTV